MVQMQETSQRELAVYGNHQEHPVCVPMRSTVVSVVWGIYSVCLTVAHCDRARNGVTAKQEPNKALPLGHVECTVRTYN